MKNVKAIRRISGKSTTKEFFLAILKEGFYIQRSNAEYNLDKKVVTYEIKKDLHGGNSRNYGYVNYECVKELQKLGFKVLKNQRTVYWLNKNVDFLLFTDYKKPMWNQTN